MLTEVATAVGVLRLLPEIVEVGKDIWKKLKPPEQLAMHKGRDGVFDRTYYSGQYGFTISIPDNNWQFWKPTPQFMTGLGLLFAMPLVAVPIMVLSKQMVRLYRPNIIVVTEDVGPFINIDELANVVVQLLTSQGLEINKDDIHISSNTNSAVVIAKQPYFQVTMYQVYQIYLYASRSYYVVTSYVPTYSESPSLLGGLQDIVNSFRLIQ